MAKVVQCDQCKTTTEPTSSGTSHVPGWIYVQQMQRPPEFLESAFVQREYCSPACAIVGLRQQISEQTDRVMAARAITERTTVDSLKRLDKEQADRDYALTHATRVEPDPRD